MPGLPVMKIIDIQHLFIADKYLFDTQPILNFDERGPKTKNLEEIQNVTAIELKRVKTKKF